MLLKRVKNIQNNLYSRCDLKISNFTPEEEGFQYYAHSYFLNSKNIKFRIAKKTSIKTGWFVTVWKRKTNGVISPYDESDPVDFFVITILSNDQIGQFIFPKSVLLEEKIFSMNCKGGKRGIRVYSPWDNVSNTQAIKTQKWQKKYFVNLSLKDLATITKIKKLYSM